MQRTPGLPSECMEGGCSMNDDFDEYDEEDYPVADRGIYNPIWMFKAAIKSSTPISRWNALAGLANVLEDAGQDEEFSRDEIIDIIVQCMYTGEYVNPFAHACPFAGKEENPITEEEIESFTTKLDFFGEDKYTDDENND